jgi:hypothetical protein
MLLSIKDGRDYVQGFCDESEVIAWQTPLVLVKDGQLRITK